jgi:hypothetical protein
MFSINEVGANSKRCTPDKCVVLASMVVVMISSCGRTTSHGIEPGALEAGVEADVHTATSPSEEVEEASAPKGKISDSDATLASLVVLAPSRGLIPVFDPQRNQYKAKLSYTTMSITLQATPAHPLAKLEINENAVDPNEPFTVSFAKEAERPARRLINVVVTAPSGKQMLTTIAIGMSTYVKASNTATKMSFGQFVAISNDTIVVSAGLESSAATGVNGNENDYSALRSGAAYVFVREENSWAQQAYLKASNTEAGDLFGGAKECDWVKEYWTHGNRRVAIDGDTIVVAAPGEDSAATGVDGDQHDNSATDSGAAYVFVRQGQAWGQQAYLKASNTRKGDQFGHSVDISGDTIVVGAVRASSAANSDNGAAYVFVRHGHTWTQQASLKPTAYGGGRYFGDDVEISGDTIAVTNFGVKHWSSSDVHSKGRAVTVFSRQGDIWTQQDRFSGVDVSGTILFGYGLALFENSLAVVGASEMTKWGPMARTVQAAFVFIRKAGRWSLLTKAALPSGNETVHFSSQLAISGDLMVAGESHEDSRATGIDGDQSDTSASNSGAAFIYRRSGNAWNQESYLKPSNTQSGDGFGAAVATSGTTVVVGAPAEDSAARGIDGIEDNNDAMDSGAVYIFE